ncbi:MAG: NADH-quinone oxidoreductase subunit M [Opitutae bacterium]|jgi:NADH-quinone oxidoreductase subunit M|nr:NADH-quinone oxidoreductase subunit M [Opitutae bacterium]MBT5716402.1 NADH-quinone oxidoreductase subunit M [Opitutae bacterium]
MTTDQILLLGSIVVPAFVSIILFSGIGRNESIVKNLAYIGFGFPFISGILLFLHFDGSSGGYCFEIFHPRMGLHELKITFHLGLNGVSSPLFAMAGIVGLAAGLTAIHSGADRLRLYLALLLTMQSGLMGLFASVDIFFYYLFHEFALIPTFIMIGLWGGRDRRSIALEITIYLTLGALISLGGLVALNVMVDAEKFDFPSLSLALSEFALAESTQFKIFGLLLFGFGILVALFPFHTWAAKGYECAPTSVSMLHAGVLKKFGLYGLIQIAAPLLPDAALAWSPYLLWLALGNIIFVGFVAIAQKNLKSMVGYGSVMHMGYCFLGIAVCSSLGAGSGVMLMVAHGLSVSLMFLLSTYIHKRSGTFEMDEMGGLGKKTPVLACFFVAASLATIGLPGFGNFWGEFGVFLSLGQNPDHHFFLYLAALGIIISAIFGLRAVAKIFYGASSGDLLEYEKKNPISDLSFSEILPAGLIMCALLFLGLWPRGISDRIDQEISSRYSQLTSDASMSLPPCCLLKEGDLENNQSLSTPLEKIPASKPSAEN